MSPGKRPSPVLLFLVVKAHVRKVSDPEALPTVPGNKVFSHHVKVTSFRPLFVVLWNTIVGLVTLMLTALFLKDTDTPLKRSPIIENRTRRFVLRSVSLGDIKMIKSAMNVTVNDVIVGVVQCALYSYLNRRYGGGENISRIPENIRLRANIAFNLRPSTHVDISGDTARQERWGNKAAFVLLPFNIKPMKDPLDYLRDVKTIMERKKASFEAVCIFFITKLSIKLLGVKQKSFKKLTTLWFSNIPGPQEEVAFCGHEIVYLAPSSYGQTAALMISEESDDEFNGDVALWTENYQVWSCAMLLALEGKNKTGFIDGSCRRSNIDEVLGRRWDRVNVVVLRCTCHVVDDFKKPNQLMKLMQLLMGFDDTYMQIRSFILSRETLPDVRSTYVIISSEESHRVASGSITGTSQRSPLLMSVHKVSRDSQLMVAFDEMNCYVSNQELMAGKILGIGKQIGRLYYFNVKQGIGLESPKIDNVCFLSKQTWHCRLGHPTDQVLDVLEPILSFENKESNLVCDVFQRAKQTKEPFPLSDHVSTELSELVGTL
ncbi:O-acyltransferase WSD1-like protein [Tanacetum coccineum]|uniref:O-acyltransferase WSD1-like protein n=1 Tax=Tanacetum coccineum TaxID=301880 RepID=A0ABQ5FD89_9ASTR